MKPIDDESLPMKDPEHACLFRRRKEARPVEQLRRYLDAWQRILSEENRANLLRLLAAESDKFPDALEWFHESVACRAKRTMTNIFEKGIANGNFHRFKPDAVADIFLSPISLCALDDVWKRDSSNEEILKVAFDILMRGLAEGFK
jgi:AcrR family transcriptional regulator